nr:hypothetical protein [bacterium]
MYLTFSLISFINNSILIPSPFLTTFPTTPSTSGKLHHSDINTGSQHHNASNIVIGNHSALDVNKNTSLAFNKEYFSFHVLIQYHIILSEIHNSSDNLTNLSFSHSSGHIIRYLQLLFILSYSDNNLNAISSHLIYCILHMNEKIIVSLSNQYFLCKSISGIFSNSFKSIQLGRITIFLLFVYFFISFSSCLVNANIVFASFNIG